MIKADFVEDGRPVVRLSRDSGAAAGAWARLQEAFSRGIVGGSSDACEVRADVFFAELEVVREVRVVFGVQVVLGPELVAQLRALANDRAARNQFIRQASDLDAELTDEELQRIGFVRTLKPFQKENLARIMSLPHGADFSVPGAGKTTVALANYANFKAQNPTAKLVVVAPLAAFGSWKEDISACFAKPPRIAIHFGQGSVISEAEIVLTTYHRVASDYDGLRSFISSQPTHLILDEAHRIKRGGDGVHGRAALDLAFPSRRRDVLTGTPAPQGAYDLVALMQFLYPGQDTQILPAEAYIESRGRDPDVLASTQRAISRYFVRTTKSRLDLGPTRFNVVRRKMGPIQTAIYDALVGRYRGTFLLETKSRREFDALGKIVMYLLEASTNPLLLLSGSDSADVEGFQHPPLDVSGDERLDDLLRKYAQYEVPWKYAEVERIVAESCAKQQKVLVWTTFVRNIKALTRHLAAFNPAVVHGGIPSEDSASGSALTREMELGRFKFDPNCSVLLANPAACGEGVSLHHWCHHAVYLDRTFNAGSFLQSQDRIHRIGLDKSITTEFTLLISADSVDDSVDARLREKVRSLALLMDDPGLVSMALPEVDTNDGVAVVYSDDAAAVMSHLRG